MKKQETILFIDTTRQDEIFVALEKDGKRIQEKSASKSANAQNVLPLIEKLLKATNLKLFDIEEIQVNPGPGSFTGVRVGVTVANMLGMLLSVPVNSKPLGQPVLPIYSPSKLD